MALEVFKWGEGISDLRNFGSTEKVRVEALQQAVEAAPSGVIFAANPHYGVYARWNLALKAAGFRLIGGRCAVNQVYGPYNWKASGIYTKLDPEFFEQCPWESRDGYHHWIHSFYLLKGEGPKELTFDFSKRTQRHGDDKSSLWQINYAGIRPYIKETYPPRFEPTYARLSYNCGAALGMGLPTCGEQLTKCYSTIAALPVSEEFPPGWKVFLKLRNLHFAHNLCSLDIAQPCPHLGGNDGA